MKIRNFRGSVITGLCLLGVLIAVEAAEELSRERQPPTVQMDAIWARAPEGSTDDFIRALPPEARRSYFQAELHKFRREGNSVAVIRTANQAICDWGYEPQDFRLDRHEFFGCGEGWEQSLAPLQAGGPTERRNLPVWLLLGLFLVGAGYVYLAHKIKLRRLGFRSFRELWTLGR